MRILMSCVSTAGLTALLTLSGCGDAASETNVVPDGSSSSVSSGMSSGGSQVPTVDHSREALLSSFTQGITLEVRDADEFNRLTNAGQNRIIQNGNSVSPSSGSPSLDFCFMRMILGTAQYQKGDKISLHMQFQGAAFSGVSPDEDFGFGCMKVTNKYVPWSLADLDKVLGGIARVSGN